MKTLRQILSSALLRKQAILAGSAGLESLELRRQITDAVTAAAEFRANSYRPKPGSPLEEARSARDDQAPTGDAEADAEEEDAAENTFRGSPQLNFYCGLFWNVSAGWHEAAKVAGVEFEPEKYDLFLRFNRHCPVWLWDRRAVFVLGRPQEIHWDDEEQLHNEAGPAVRYTETFCLWVIHGVSVDEQIVMAPETQTVAQIRDEPNEEVKRIRIERYGWVKYLEERNAKLIDERRNDIENTRESLLRTDDHTVLLTHCPSTGKLFALECPAGTMTCEEAQDWLHSGSEIDNLLGKPRVIGRS